MKKKIIFCVTVALLVFMLGALVFEATLVNTKESYIGEWKSDSGNEILLINANGTVSLNSGDGAAQPYGLWEYSWFKLILTPKGEEPVLFKKDSLKMSSDYASFTKIEKDRFEPANTTVFYSEGFFGYGEQGNFKYWSFAHFTPILILALAIYLIYHYREAIRNSRHEENLRFFLAAAMILVEMSYFWRLLYVGSSEPGASIDMLDKLPLQVCEWTCIFAVFMMAKKSRAIYPICFYVCLTIGIFPLLTPSVITTTGPAYYRYYQFWLEHMLPPIAVFYMTFVHGFRPTKRGIITAVCFMSALTTLALICNANIPGANYLYLAEGTVDGGGSIMDPIRDMVGGSTVALLFLLGALVIGIFFLAYYISRWIESFSKKKNGICGNK